jgi:CBS domain containing-hemolysin-like protein
MVIISVACVILSAYFSATETAFTTLNRVRIKTKADDGNKRAKQVLNLVEKYDKLLTTILIGNNIVNVLLTALATLLFVEWVGGSWGPTVSTVATTVIVLIFGEITPKTLAKEYPETFATFSAPFINFLMIVFTPFTLLFGLWKMLLCKIFRHKEDTTITDDELLTMVDEAEQEGGINAQEKELIKSAIEFDGLEAKDILVPRIDLIAVEDTVPTGEIASIFTESGYSRLPVYHETIDNIVGILHEKDFIRHMNDKNLSIDKLLKPAVFVVSTTKISKVLQYMQKTKSHMAIVSGEFGDTLGIVTMEDILEELVGEIWDEHDEVITDITPISETEFKVAGSTTIIDLEDCFDIEIDTESSTAGGWVIELLGKVPQEGDKTTFGNLEITVTKTDTRRITELLFVVHHETEEE